MKSNITPKKITLKIEILSRNVQFAAGVPLLFFNWRCERFFLFIPFVELTHLSIDSIARNLAATHLFILICAGVCVISNHLLLWLWTPGGGGGDGRDFCGRLTSQTLESNCHLHFCCAHRFLFFFCSLLSLFIVSLLFFVTLIGCVLKWRWYVVRTSSTVKVSHFLAMRFFILLVRHRRRSRRFFCLFASIQIKATVCARTISPQSVTVYALLLSSCGVYTNVYLTQRHHF